MLNSVALMGRLTADPEMRNTQSGTAVTTFTLAVDREYHNGDGERQTDFVTVVAWRKTAEHIARWFHKGQMMALHGSLQSRKWEDRDGNRRTSWEVIADSVYFCGDKKNADVATVSAEGFVDLDDDEGEIPF